MRWLLNLRLSVKFGFMVIFIIGVMTTAITYVTMRAYYQYQLENLRAKAQSTGELLADLAREPLQRRDSAALESLLQKLAADPDLSYAAVRSQDDPRQAWYHSDQSNSEANLNMLLSDEQLFHLHFPIVSDASDSELVLGVSHHRIDQNHDRTLRELLLTTLLIIGGLCLVIYLDFLYIVLHPIRHLLNGIQRVTGGELSGQVQKFYDDEVGGLTDAFNTMTQRLNSVIAEKDSLTKTAQRQSAELAEQVEEGQRIMRDLHDDVGAQLLTLVHRAESGANADIARHALHNLRETIRGLAKGENHVSIRDALDDWHDEARERLDAASIQLHWQQSEDIPYALFNNRQLINLSRILRETLTNTIKHAVPASIHVQTDVDERGVRIRIDDDGNGGDPRNWQAGTGLSNMQTRAQEIGAQLRWLSGANQRSTGTEIFCPLSRES